MSAHLTLTRHVLHMGAHPTLCPFMGAHPTLSDTVSSQVRTLEAAKRIKSHNGSSRIASPEGPLRCLCLCHAPQNRAGDVVGGRGERAVLLPRRESADWLAAYYDQVLLRPVVVVGHHLP